jgi:hypothetical protein
MEPDGKHAGVMKIPLHPADDELVLGCARSQLLEKRDETVARIGCIVDEDELTAYLKQIEGLNRS